MLSAILEFAKALPRGQGLLNLRRLFYRKACTAIIGNSKPHPGFFAQHAQDRFLDGFVFCGRRDGFFVEVGAYDGISLSNTYFFERLGWRGICLEPNPSVFEKLQSNRTSIVVNAGVAATPGTMAFLSLPNDLDLGSGFIDFFDAKSLYGDRNFIDQVCTRGGRVLDIEVVNLNGVLREHGVSRVDYLSIDTEGADWDILKSIDFAQFDIEVVSVENVGLADKVASHMEQQGYALIAVLGADEIYKKSIGP